MPAWTDDEALAWMRTAGGQLHRRPAPQGSGAYAVLLRSPAAKPGPGRLILAFGDSIAEAVAAARLGWEQVWRDLPSH